jgi:hypothetical protein
VEGRDGEDGVERRGNEGGAVDEDGGVDEDEGIVDDLVVDRDRAGDGDRVGDDDGDGCPDVWPVGPTGDLNARVGRGE